MKTTFNLKVLSAAAAASMLMLPLAGNAADEKDKHVVDRAGVPIVAGPGAVTMTYSDRQNNKPWTNEKDLLKATLKSGQDRAFYRKALADHGYVITSINADDAEHVEYEVVKGVHSYEIKLDFDKGAATATKVEVDANMWRADATKAAMRGAKTEAATAYVPANARFSDRARMKAWTGEKEKLEKALTPGQDKAAYVAQLKKLGYQVTSTNDREKDYLEYEIVKGSDSYEVQIDLENGKAKKIDVTTNMWQSEATEKAIEGSKGKS